MEGKKSVVIYCDLIHTVESLEDDEAGRLFKHFLRYVNDLNPEAPDRITQITFEPIKQQLKRDLIKWNETREIRSENGKKGGIASGEARRSKTKQTKQTEPIASESKQTQANEAVTVNVTVNDNVNANVTVTDIEERKNIFINELSIFLNQYGREMLNAFFDYWSEPNKLKTKCDLKWSALGI